MQNNTHDDPLHPCKHECTHTLYTLNLLTSSSKALYSLLRKCITVAGDTCLHMLVNPTMSANMMVTCGKMDDESSRTRKGVRCHAATTRC